MQTGSDVYSKPLTRNPFSCLSSVFAYLFLFAFFVWFSRDFRVGKTLLHTLAETAKYLSASNS